MEVDRLHSQAAWQQKLTPAQTLPAHVSFEPDGRRSSALPVIVGGGLAEAAVIGGDHPSRRSNEDIGKLSESAKSRLTLDGHMATTSSPKAASVPHKVTTNGTVPLYTAMAIPAFNPRSHARPNLPLPSQSQPQPQPLPPLHHSTPSASQPMPPLPAPIQMSKASLVIPPHVPKSTTPSGTAPLPIPANFSQFGASQPSVDGAGAAPQRVGV